MDRITINNDKVRGGSIISWFYDVLYEVPMEKIRITLIDNLGKECFIEMFRKMSKVFYLNLYRFLAIKGLCINRVEVFFNCEKVGEIRDVNKIYSFFTVEVSKYFLEKVKTLKIPTKLDLASCYCSFRSCEAYDLFKNCISFKAGFMGLDYVSVYMNNKQVLTFFNDEMCFMFDKDIMIASFYMPDQTIGSVEAYMKSVVGNLMEYLRYTNECSGSLGDGEELIDISYNLAFI